MNQFSLFQIPEKNDFKTFGKHCETFCCFVVIYDNMSVENPIFSKTILEPLSHGKGV
jgi:hypothetical protein